MSAEPLAAYQSAEATTVFEENSLLDQILVETRMTPQDDGYDVAKKGIAAFLSELMKPSREGEKVNNSVIDQMIAALDAKLSLQVDEILHAEEFQKIESAWRGLKFVVDRTDFRQNIRLEIMNCSKEELIDDFEDSPEMSGSGLYKHVYAAEYGQFGGKPFGAIIANYEFSASTRDVQLMRNMSSVAAMAHAPVIASTAPAMFGIDSFEQLSELKDLDMLFEGPKYQKWQHFRESDDARYLGLTTPRFLLRNSYGEEGTTVRSFNYQENLAGKSKNCLWGNAAFAFATRLSDSFAQYRWCPNIIGPQSGGTVSTLPTHAFETMGQVQNKIPTDVLISDRREYELAEMGFISLSARKGSDDAVFFSANSVQKAKNFSNSPEGRRAETNYKLGTQLPYMMMINRLAHYVKVIQRENIGSWKTREDLQSELNTWVSNFVADQDNPSAEVRSRCPLRKAEILVTEVEGEAGWYSVSMNIVPHFKYMGADFTLSLRGRLDRS